MISIRISLASIILPLVLGGCREAQPTGTEIKSQELGEGVIYTEIEFAKNTWRTVTMDLKKAKPSIRFADASGKAMRDFSAFEKSAEAAQEKIIWMMNAGMYHHGGSPVGLCISDGNKISPVNRSGGHGNFFLKPNGIFFLNEEGAQVIETSEWNPTMTPPPLCATQSGPLLVRRGKFHPSIRPESTSKFIRNGVGVRANGHLCFAISTNQVSFHEMALFFRDYLKCPDVLYLDGNVSRLYVPAIGLTPKARGLGPVFGLWE